MRADPLWQGAAGGLVATIPMSMAMALLRQPRPAERTRPPAPIEVTKSAFERLIKTPPPPTLAQVAGSALHFVVGATTGAPFPWLYDRLGRRWLASGLVHGLAVYTFGYWVLLPLTRLQPPPWRQPRERHTTLIVSHLVWGAALGLLVHTFFTASARRRSPAV